MIQAMNFTNEHVLIFETRILTMLPDFPITQGVKRTRFNEVT